MSEIHQTSGGAASVGASGTVSAGQATPQPAAGRQVFSKQLALAMDKASQNWAPTKSANHQQVESTDGTVTRREMVNHDFDEQALRLLALRQQILASNIANADTPGYKAVDVDVPDALRKGLSVNAVPLKYHIPNQGSIDANTVEMDVERAKFTENAIKYEFMVVKVRDHYMMLSEMLKNLT